MFQYTPSSTLSICSDTDSGVRVLQIPAGQTEARHWLDIGLGAHYLDGEASVSEEMKDLVSRFPDWTVPIGWTATLQHYQL